MTIQVDKHASQLQLKRKARQEQMHSLFDKAVSICIIEYVIWLQF